MGKSGSPGSRVAKTILLSLSFLMRVVRHSEPIFRGSISRNSSYRLLAISKGSPFANGLSYRCRFVTVFSTLIRKAPRIGDLKPANILYSRKV